MARKGRTYALYTRCPEGREPKVSASIPVYDDDDHEIGNETVLVTKWGFRRGARIYETTTYKDLVDKAHSLCAVIGLPKSRWSDIFDWNQPT